MSKIHVLTGGAGSFNAVVHSVVPVGNNLVGISWQTCIANSSYLPLVSRLTIGTGAGQISAIEAAQVAAGTVVEYELTIPLNADGSAPSSSFIDNLANKVISDRNQTVAASLQYFGYTQ